MTLDDLAALEKASTPGPWVTVNDGFHAGVGTKKRHDETAQGCTKYVLADICGGDSCEGYFDGPNAAFIAAIRNATPVLIEIAKHAEKVSEFLGERWCEDHAYRDRFLLPLREALARLEGVGK